MEGTKNCELRRPPHFEEGFLLPKNSAPGGRLVPSSSEKGAGGLLFCLRQKEDTMKKLSVLLLLLTMTTSNVHAACSSNLPCEVGSDNSGMSNAESAALVVGSALALGALFGYISDHYYNHKKHEKHVDLSKKYTIRIEKYAQK